MVRKLQADRHIYSERRLISPNRGVLRDSRHRHQVGNVSDPETADTVTCLISWRLVLRLEQAVRKRR